MEYQKDSLRGWVVVGAALVGLSLCVGTVVLYSFGVLSSAMMKDLGWTEVQRTSVFLAFSLCSTLAGPLWGSLADRLGGKRVILTSTVLMALCFVAISRLSTDPVFAMVAFAAMGLLGAGTLPPIFVSVVVGWFDRRRGLALGLSMFGVGLGAAVFPVVAAALINAWGWRVTALVFGGLVVAISLPVTTLFLSPFPENTALAENNSQKAQAALGQVFRQGKTWVLLFFALATGTVLFSIVVSLVPILQARGEPLMAAARLQSVLGISLLVGRVATGALLDRFFAPHVMFAVLLMTAGGIVLLAVGEGNAAHLLAAIGIGLALGAEVDFMSFLVSRYFPATRLAAILSILFATYSLGGSIGPLLFGFLSQRVGGYGPALLMAAVVILLAGTMILTLPRYPMFAARTRA